MKRSSWFTPQISQSWSSHHARCRLFSAYPTIQTFVRFGVISTRPAWWSRTTGCAAFGWSQRRGPVFSFGISATCSHSISTGLGCPKASATACCVSTVLFGCAVMGITSLLPSMTVCPSIWLASFLPDRLLNHLVLLGPVERRFVIVRRLHAQGRPLADGVGGD